MPFNDKLEEWAHNQSGWYGSGINLVDNIRDHSFDVEESKLDIFQRELMTILPEDGWMDIYLKDDPSDVIK